MRAQNPFIKKYTAADGLPSNVINIIQPDREKFLWLATGGGLVRYDGTSFTNYNTKDGLSQNNILVIKEDSFKRVWLFCIGMRLNFFYQNKIYNRDSLKFLDSLAGNWNFVQDRQGNLYFFNYHRRTIKVLDTNNHVKIYTLPSEPIKDNSLSSDGMNIQYLTRFPSGEFMIWTYTGMYKTNNLSENPVEITHFDRYHNIFAIGDTSMYDVIAYPETHSTVLIRYEHGFPSDTTLFSEAALDNDASVMQDADGNVWISSNVKGLYCLKNKKIIFHLDLKGIIWISQDHEKNIWVTSEDGAYKISPYALIFKHYDNSYFQNGGVNALSTDPQGRLWGLYGSNIFLYENSKFYTKDFSYINPNIQDLNALDYNSIIVYDYRKSLFAITGITKIPSGKTLKFEKTFPLPFEGSVALPMVNKSRDEVCIYNAYNGIVTNYNVHDNFREKEQFTVKAATHIFYDARDNLVVLEPKAHYIIQNGEKIPYNEFARLSRALPVTHETLDTIGDLFLTMYDSLYLVKQQKVFNLTSSFDYSFNTPVQRITYQSPVLYLATCRNIYTCENPLDIKENSAIPLRLIDINFFGISDILAINDLLYVASGNGLTIFPIELIDQIKTKAPQPYFQSIKINDDEADLYSGEIMVRGKNKISFEFSSINYSDNPVMFSYMLEGYDEKWNTGSTNSVAYANLPMGKYKFRVKAGKTNSPWSDPIEFNIQVKATFWQRPIFYVLLSFLITAMISLIVIYRKNLQMKKIETEHQLVTLEQKALQSMMNPHFLFNALGSIQHYLLQNKPAEAGLYLSQFARLVRQNIHGINNPMLSLEAETDRLKNYLDLEKMRMKNRFDYSFKIDEEIMDDAVLIPSMIIQPFVENSILHGISPLEKGGMITISFSMVTDKAIKIAIEDNGVGINQSKAFKSDSPGHLHLSIEMTKKRIDILGKKYKVTTSLEVTEAFPTSTNPGTRVTVVLPVSYGEEE
jgi:hypothetical protein